VKWAGVHPGDPALVNLFGVGETDAGIQVTETRALNCAAVFAAVRLISESVASLPAILYERIDDGKQRATEHPTYVLLHDTPNPEMTAFSFHESLQGQSLMRGNGYAEIERNGAGKPLALWPLPPDRVKPRRDANGRRYYEVQTASGVRNLPAENIIHIPGLGFDGTVGYDVLSLARESLGLTLGVEKSGAKYFGNGSRPGGVLEVPGRLSEDARKNLKESFAELHQGLSNAHRLAVLEEGMKWAATGNTPEEAQFLETRRFQTVEVCRWFNVPPHMLRDLDRATFSNIEHQGIDFVTYTLRPWLIRREQEFNRKLLTAAERKTMFFEHLVDALLRGDTQSRYAAYSVALNNGFASPNDIQRWENRNPINVPEADQYRRAVNLVPMGSGITNTGDLVSIASAVQAGTLSPDAAGAILDAAYPLLTDDQRKGILSGTQKPSASAV
jgi:HK97 family phage portal protein